MEQKAERKQEVETLQKKCNEDKEIIVKRKSMVEVEIKDIKPMVDAAKEAVGQLKPANLQEIKSYVMPPDAVSDVL